MLCLKPPFRRLLMQHMCADRVFCRCLPLLLLGVLGLCLTVTSVFAQTDRGTVRGRVTDTQGAVLRAARVEVQPGGQYAITDDQGQFEIADLAPGEHTVTASYAGFAPFTKTVQVTAGQTVRADAVMKVASATEAIVVTADRGRGE